jgi:hypothetical protein
VHDLSPARPSTSLAIRTLARLRRHADPAVSAVLAAALVLTPLATIATMTRTVAAAPTGTEGALEIEVLTLSSNDAVEEAAAFTDAMKHAMIEAVGVTEHGSGGKGHALEAILLTVGCDDATTAACSAKIAAEIKHDRFVFGTVKKSPPNKLTATLSYYNKGEVKTVAKTYDAGPVAKDGTSPELKAIALDALYGLIGGPPKAQVEVVVVGPAANESGDLYEGENKVGHVEAGKATIELPAGSHTLELRMPGYASSTANVEVGATGSKMQFAPVRLAPSKPVDWQLYGGLGAIAVGAVFVGVGVATSLSIKDAQDDPTFTNYRKRFSTNVGDTCEKARAGDEGKKQSVSDPNLAPQIVDLCDKVKSKQTMQFVWYGLGAAFIAGGTILILTDKTGDSAPAPEGTTAKAKPPLLTVKVQPTFGPNYNALSLVGAF